MHLKLKILTRELKILCRERIIVREMGKGMRDCMHLKLKILSRERVVKETRARECMIACI